MLALEVSIKADSFGCSRDAQAAMLVEAIGLTQHAQPTSSGPPSTSAPDGSAEAQPPRRMPSAGTSAPAPLLVVKGAADVRSTAAHRQDLEPGRHVGLVQQELGSPGSNTVPSEDAVQSNDRQQQRVVNGRTGNEAGHSTIAAPPYKDDKPLALTK